jgi:hypothetical protein
MRLTTKKMQTPLSRANERAILMETKWRSNLSRKESYFFSVSSMVSGVSFWTVILRVTVL